jgi:hypothetical protein
VICRLLRTSLMQGDMIGVPAGCDHGDGHGSDEQNHYGEPDGGLNPVGSPAQRVAVDTQPAGAAHQARPPAGDLAAAHRGHLQRSRRTQLSSPCSAAGMTAQSQTVWPWESLVWSYGERPADRPARYRSSSPAAGAWQRAGGALTSAPPATTYPAHAPYVVALGTDGNLWQGVPPSAGTRWVWTQIP